MKTYTDLEKSKTLAEILPKESADMCYSPHGYKYRLLPCSDFEVWKDEAMSAWSLGALLDVLPYPQLSKDKLGGGKEGWMVSAYPDNCRYDSCWHDNPIDACIEMILKLYVLKLL